MNFIKKLANLQFIKNLLRSRAVQGALTAMGGALVKYLEALLPEYGAVINAVSLSLVGGGTARAVYGRAEATGPITLRPGSGQAQGGEGRGGVRP